MVCQARSLSVAAILIIDTSRYLKPGKESGLIFEGPMVLKTAREGSCENKENMMNARAIIADKKVDTEVMN
jgi:hypothetical protein